MLDPPGTLNMSHRNFGYCTYWASRICINTGLWPDWIRIRRISMLRYSESHSLWAGAGRSFSWQNNQENIEYATLIKLLFNVTFTGCVTPKVPWLCSPCLCTSYWGLLLYLNVSQLCIIWISGHWNKIKIWLIFRCSRRPLPNVNKQGEQRPGTFGVTDPVHICQPIWDPEGGGVEWEKFPPTYFIFYLFRQALPLYFYFSTPHMIFLGTPPTGRLRLIQGTVQHRKIFPHWFNDVLLRVQVICELTD